MKFDPLLDDDVRSDRPLPEPSWSQRHLVAIALGVLAVLITVVAVVLLDRSGDDEPTSGPDATATTLAAPPPTAEAPPVATQPVTPDAPAATAAAVPTVPPTTSVAATPGAAESIDTPGSLWWLVNASRPLPPGYVPPDLVTPSVPVDPDLGTVELSAPTAAAFEAMAAEATTAGYQLRLNSGYRSEADQRRLYDLYVRDYGRDVAATLVAVPGTSEHQTGLAADVGLVGLPDDQVFGSTPASAWVAANAHRFGFILRYPPDKAAITGYANEPWHLRYVGVELAGELHASGQTMEERFGLVPAG